MSEAYVVEVDGTTVGVVVRHRRGFRFHASDPAFMALEGGLYRLAEDATRSAQILKDTLRQHAAKAKGASDHHPHPWGRDKPNQQRSATGSGSLALPS